MIYNGLLLKDVFAETQSLFRPREEMMSQCLIGS